MPQSPVSNPPASRPWKGITEEQAIEHAHKACAHPDRRLDQGEYGLCGPVAVLHALAKESEDEFVELTKRVYRDPRNLIPDDFKAKPDLGQQHNAVMLMLATSLTNERSHIFQYHATLSNKDLVAGAAFPRDLVSWLKKFFPSKTVTEFNSYCWGVMDNAHRINGLWCQSPKPLVFAFVNYKHLMPKPSGIGSKLPGLLGICAATGHYIQITSPISECSDNTVEFDAFTWGYTQKYKMPERQFEKLVLELIVAQ